MAERIAPGVTRLDLGFRAPLGATAYLADDGDLTLVDAGMPINRRRVRSEIADAGYAIHAIDRVLITHYDLDHLGGLARLTPHLDAPVYLGQRDLDLLRGGYDPPLLHHKGLFHRALRTVYSPPASLTYRAVVNGERIGGFEAYHTPGHNPGHTAFVHEGLDAAFLGDLVWESDGEFVAPPWLDSYDTDRIARSISRVAGESFEHACVGHGRPVSPAGDAVLRELAAEL